MMIIDHEYFPLGLAGALAIFYTVHRRLNQAVQPLRLHLAERGEALLADPELPPSARDHVEFLLDTAFGMRATLLFGIFIVPVVAALFVVRNRWIRTSVDKMKIQNAESRARFYELCRLHDRITLSNHPILLPIIELQLVVFMPIAILLRGLIFGKLPETGGRESVITFIEDKRVHGLSFAHAKTHR